MSRRNDRGAVAVLVAVCAIALFAASALVVDLGQARDTKRKAQNAADASALAAGNALYLGVDAQHPRITQAVAAAKTYAAENYGVTAADWASCTDSNHLTYVPASSTPCISFDQSTKPLQARVKMPPRTVRTPLASVFPGGRHSVVVAAKARASLLPDAKSKCALCVLGSGVHDLGNGDATAAGGDIAFNGSVNVQNNGLVATDGSILVQGTATGPLANYSPDPTTGQPPASDPLAFVPLPPDMSSLTTKTNPCSQGPGIYGSVNLRNVACTLLPGLYVVAGSGSVWDLAGNSSTKLLGTGVTIYLTCGTTSAPAACASGQSGATIDASGSGTLGFTAPTTGPLQGLGIVMDRKNTSTIRLTGNGASGFKGTIYMPSGTLQMNGNGCAAIDSLVVVKDLTMNGNPPCLNSTYLPSDNVTFPPDRLFLSQ